MSGFPNKPKILRGDFDEYGLSSPPLFVVIQFNQVQPKSETGYVLCPTHLEILAIRNVYSGYCRLREYIADGMNIPSGTGR